MRVDDVAGTICQTMVQGGAARLRRGGAPCGRRGLQRGTAVQVETSRLPSLKARWFLKWGMPPMDHYFLTLKIGRAPLWTIQRLKAK
jgi:hypothetical protein